EELDVDHVGVAADGTVLDVALLVAGGGVERDLDRLAAARTDVGAVVERAPALRTKPATSHPVDLRLGVAFIASFTRFAHGGHRKGRPKLPLRPDVVRDV